MAKLKQHNFYTFQLQSKLLIWTNLADTIIKMKEINTSPKKILTCLTKLREAELCARKNLYGYLGNNNVKT